MKLGTLCLLLFLTLSFEISLFAQKPTPTPKKEEDEVVRVDTELVDVPVIVMDATGKPVLNLKQTNFAIFEDGKNQEVADFAATSAPFEVALLLDTSGSTRSELQLIQRAAQIFIDSLRPGDRVSIISFTTAIEGNRRVPAAEVLSGLTGDRAALKAALDRVSTSNGTPYYDAMMKVVDDVFKSEPKDSFRGRRALVALTDGVDSTSIADFEETREGLERAGVTAYFVQVDTRPYFEEGLLGPCEGATRFSTAQIRRYYRSFGSKANLEKTSNFCDLGDFERLAISKKLYEIANIEMTSVAKQSGGKVFPAGDLNDARTAFRSVAAEIGTKYSLGYYSSNNKRDGSYRKIRVELRGLPIGAQVRAREGYTAPTN
ncbi:MAG TPA: VWA domain-containing protein [Pyrinomonadaceae bacterium]|nr:VWA domain-containing protein [Pyrinomonadaceae bacterium]